MFGLSQNEKDDKLYRALDHGDTTEVRKQLERGADPNAKSYHGHFIFKAIGHYEEANAVACVKAMLDKGASLTVTDNYGRTPLHNAVNSSRAHMPVIKMLIDAGADIGAVDKYGSTPLCTAIAHKGFVAAEYLLGYCAHDDKAAVYGLPLAVMNGASLDFLRKLEEKLGINVNSVVEDSGTTALHAAVGRDDVVEWLLAHKGIDVNKKNEEGKTPLHLAVYSSYKAAVKKLLDAGAQPDCKDKDGQVPIVMAARSNNQEILEMLVAAKAELDQKDQYGMTALTVASGAGSIRMVMTLLAAADTAGKKLELEPALAAAAEKGHGRILELLIAAGADVNSVDSEGRSPLMKGVAADQVETLSILLKAGASPDQSDRHGMFAYDYAVSQGKTKAKAFLARYRPDMVKSDIGGSPAVKTDEYQFMRVNDHSLEVREGEGLTMTFNFWTQQVIFRDTERPAPVTVQNFADLQRQEAIDEAYAKLKELGGNPPDPGVTPMRKKLSLGK